MTLEQDLREQRARITRRVRHLREDQGLSQVALASAVGLPSPKAVSMIENGEREVSPEELTNIAKFFGKPVDFFVDPTLLTGEGTFSWRAKGPSEMLSEFESRASRWIGAWRTANQHIGGQSTPFKSTIPLNSSSTFEDAWTAAEQIVEKWNLGQFPAVNLAEKAETELDVLVLMVDAPAGISGAACWIKEFGTILINRRESEGRRNFDLAHELFHLLTWQAMPPKYYDSFIELDGTKRSRAEMLADNFAGALLMPEKFVRQSYEKKGKKNLFEWLDETAPQFRVTILALYWRLVALRMINKNREEEAIVSSMHWNGQKTPTLFSKKFLSTIFRSVDEGYMSHAFTAKLLGISREELDRVFNGFSI